MKLTRYRVVLELDIATGDENEHGIRLGPECWRWARKLDLDDDERVRSVEVYKQDWERIK